MSSKNNFTLPMLEWCETPAGRVMIDGVRVVWNSEGIDLGKT